MTKRNDYRDDLLNDLRNDFGYAAEYLSAAYKDSKESFLVALRDVTEARRGIAKIARGTRLNRESLYRTLSKDGNPRLSTLGSLLDELGMSVRVEPKDSVAGTGPRNRIFEEHVEKTSLKYPDDIKSKTVLPQGNVVRIDQFDVFKNTIQSQPKPDGSFKPNPLFMQIRSEWRKDPIRRYARQSQNVSAESGLLKTAGGMR